MNKSNSTTISGLPEKLFRYMPWNTYTLDTLINKHLYMALPTSFNDEFEVLVPIFKQFPEAQGDLDDINRNETRMICFTDSYQNSMMWYNYAGHNEGICLEYTNLWDNNDNIKPMSFNIEEDGTNKSITVYKNEISRGDVLFMSKVHYSDKMPEINIETSFDVRSETDLFQKMYETAIKSIIPFFLKSSAWEKEHETRIVRINADKESYYDFDDKKLTGIYLGTKMSDESKTTIRKIINHYYPTVNIHELERMPDQYGYRDKNYGIIDEKDLHFEISD